jgi:hypothetical protein
MANGTKTGGRKAGTPNKTTSAVRALAQDYGHEAIELLATIMRSSQNEAVKISSARELLDRGYGKAQPAIEVQRIECSEAYYATPEGIESSKKLNTLFDL